MAFLCFSINPVTSQTSNDLKELVNDLFSSYSLKVRPVVNQQQPLLLDVSFYLSSINEVNEVKEKMVTTGYLDLLWTDELLEWTPADYKNTKPIFVPQVQENTNLIPLMLTLRCMFIYFIILHAYTTYTKCKYILTKTVYDIQSQKQCWRERCSSK